MLSGLYALLLVIVGTVLPVAESIADPVSSGAFEVSHVVNIFHFRLQPFRNG